MESRSGGDCGRRSKQMCRRQGTRLRAKSVSGCERTTATIAAVLAARGVVGVVSLWARARRRDWWSAPVWHATQLAQEMCRAAAQGCAASDMQGRGRARVQAI